MIDMELPDKIYVTTYSVNSRYGNRFGCWTERECPGYAYIRKDALLEKIDDAIAHLSDGSITEYYESLVYKDIRELIESM